MIASVLPISADHPAKHHTHVGRAWSRAAARHHSHTEECWRRRHLASIFTNSSTHGLAAQAFEAEGDAAEAADMEAAGAAPEGAPRVVSESEQAAKTPTAAARLRLLGALDTLLLRGAGGTSGGEPRRPPLGG